MRTLSSGHARRAGRANDANIDRLFLLVLIGATAVILATLAVVNWASRSAAPVASAQFDNLLPLAQPVNPIAGFHNMERMPNLSAPARPAAAGTPQSNVDLPLATWDWGTIPARPAVMQTFPIQNTGDQPLLITNVVTSCGCTTAQLSSSVVPAGQRADLVVTFDPDFHATSGPVTRLVWLETNDPDQPVVELRMDANVIP
ncbi:MAG: DUF1573 domain-containing protein [Caldilineaceae bacterium]|nr:DUF1573 domain-containing protein [Caldilineaceae bacterium]